MADFLDKVDSGLGSAIDGINKAQNWLNGQNNPLTQSQADSFRSDGFLIPANPSADGTGLPYNKVPNNNDATLKRNIITWFVPQFGIVRMFVNPQNISYQDKKIIHKDRTKGGYTLQYWGEELTTLSISGTTGSSGIEGINALWEVYRAEQFAFDAVGLSLAANNAAADAANNLVSGLGGALGQGINSILPGPLQTNSASAGAAGAGLLGGILGLDSPNNNLSQRNIPSLAQLAFTVEMYYNGWVYRGYFEHFTLNERADSFALEYQMSFVATQRRGYRTNYFPFHHNPSQASDYNTPLSFSGIVKSGQ